VPVRIEWIDSGRGIVLKGAGKLTGPEMIEAKEEVARDEAQLRRVEFWLVVFTEVEAFHITIQDIRELAAIDHRLAVHLPRSAVALVAPRDHDFGMARMWEAILDIPGWTTSVFRERAEAEAWLRTVAPRPAPTA
jgi:hypothetical protein